ncbi:uncharacterized protein VTP21DRAFT_10729 [Calcarisporiella thermophila]|uniref:uncharacterized protein n=1 Tax=Calcarisporiella thermophila TaxID=911321 RepID=UPI003743320D
MSGDCDQTLPRRFVHPACQSKPQIPLLRSAPRPAPTLPAPRAQEIGLWELRDGCHRYERQVVGAQAVSPMYTLPWPSSVTTRGEFSVFPPLLPEPYAQIILNSPVLRSQFS